MQVLWAPRRAVAAHVPGAREAGARHALDVARVLGRVGGGRGVPGRDLLAATARDGGLEREHRLGRHVHAVLVEHGRLDGGVLAGAAAVDINVGPAGWIMATVLFLWTPPHFWALAYACKSDYRKAGVPMLPVLVDDRTATWVILGHVVALVALSILPVFYGLSWIYFLGAAGGGIYFAMETIKFHLKPTIPQAWRTFASSIAQLGLMLVAAILDRIVLG